MILPLALSLASCIAIAPGSANILARDVASAFPALAAASPDAAIALAPAPGAARVFRANDVRMLAARFHLDAAAEPFCVARPVAPLDRASLLNAMKASLPQASIEILEFARQPAPAGEIEFPVRGLHPDSGRYSGLWDGAVCYAGSRRFPIWAKVRITAAAERVVASADLHPGQLIQAAQLAVQTVDTFPSETPWADSIQQVAGRWPRLLIRAGSSVRLDQLETPRDVMRGALVHVEVRDGAARLLFDAVAQGSGSAGQWIAVLNPASQKTFRARIEGPGRVSLVAAAAPVPEKPQKPQNPEDQKP